MNEYKFSGYLVLARQRWYGLRARLSVRKPTKLTRGEVLVYFTVVAPAAWFEAPPLYSAKVTLDEPGTGQGTASAIARAVSQVTGLTVVLEEATPEGVGPR